jgi:hypothetical protein
MKENIFYLNMNSLIINRIGNNKNKKFKTVQNIDK